MKNKTNKIINVIAALGKSIRTLPKKLPKLKIKPVFGKKVKQKKRKQKIDFTFIYMLVGILLLAVVAVFAREIAVRKSYLQYIEQLRSQQVQQNQQAPQVAQ